jgi:hypothetical protein
MLKNNPVNSQINIYGLLSFYHHTPPPPQRTICTLMELLVIVNDP